MAEDTDSQSGIVIKQESKDIVSGEPDFQAKARKSRHKGSQRINNNLQLLENPLPHPNLSDDENKFKMPVSEPFKPLPYKKGDF